MDYALRSPSYSPIYSPSGRPAILHLSTSPRPQPSLYEESIAPSIASGYSGEGEGSMTHFRHYDTLGATHSQGSYPDFASSSSRPSFNRGGSSREQDGLDPMKFGLAADPSTYSLLGPEEDDDLHDPEVNQKYKRRVLTWRAVSNLGCLFVLLLILVVLFAGYPVFSEVFTKATPTLGAYNLGGINSTGQLPDIGPFQLIDQDTPSSAYTHTSLETGDTWELVFSDEFNREGRTFYDGDDPYWEAVDLHYWQTNNLEWYSPSHLTTKGGNLVVTLNNQPLNGLNYTGAMMTTWNRFCYTGGYIEASVSLPGSSNVYGLWPAIWTMGNLGRAGYGGSLDGLWPYSYDSCDVGTLPNQTLNGLPEVATTQGDVWFNNSLSYLPGQRLSRCTCPGDPNHPGPVLSNGTFIGRSAPEIDMFEATVDSTLLIGQVSQSAQWAPFNPYYNFVNNSNTYTIYDDDVTALNTYLGGVYQQATSGLSTTNQDCYTGNTGCFSVYGFEYAPGPDGYITWISNSQKAWTVRGAAMGPNAPAEVGQRPISEEPMYIIINLGISENFGAVDFEGLESLWPVTMLIDYIRVYQDPNNPNIGCDPAAFPTASYIESIADAYSDPNITIFGDIPGAVLPKNNLIDTC